MEGHLLRYDILPDSNGLSGAWEGGPDLTSPKMKDSARLVAASFDFIAGAPTQKIAFICACSERVASPGFGALRWFSMTEEIDPPPGTGCRVSFFAGAQLATFNPVAVLYEWMFTAPLPGDAWIEPDEMITVGAVSGQPTNTFQFCQLTFWVPWK